MRERSGIEKLMMIRVNPGSGCAIGLSRTGTAPLVLEKALEGPAKQMRVRMNPVQEGSGTPSPENIRPFSGRTGIWLRVSGVNQWDEEWVNEKKSVDEETGEIESTEGFFFRSKNFIPAIAGTAYRLVNGMRAEGTRIFFYDAEKNYLSYTECDSGDVFTVPGSADSESAVERRDAVENTETDVEDENILWEYGADYRDGSMLSVDKGGYLVQTYNADGWTPSRLEIKNGALSSENGGAEICWMLFAFASEDGAEYGDNIALNYPASETEYAAFAGDAYSADWTDAAGTVYGGTIDLVKGELVVDTGMIASYAGEALPGRWLSDRDEYAEGTLPTEGAQVVYELAEPETYTLSAQDVETVAGTNVVVTDANGVIAAKYGAGSQEGKKEAEQ